MFTRHQYMTKECTHREYYAQYVSPGVLRAVSQFIGVDRINASSDPYFNDIPLKDWDICLPRGLVSRARKELGDTPGESLSDLVCTAKEAARQIAGRGPLPS